MTSPSGPCGSVQTGTIEATQPGPLLQILTGPYAGTVGSSSSINLPAYLPLPPNTTTIIVDYTLSGTLQSGTFGNFGDPWIAAYGAGITLVDRYGDHTTVTLINPTSEQATHHLPASGRVVITISTTSGINVYGVDPSTGDVTVQVGAYSGRVFNSAFVLASSFIPVHASSGSFVDPLGNTISWNEGDFVGDSTLAGSGLVYGDVFQQFTLSFFCGPSGPGGLPCYTLDWSGFVTYSGLTQVQGVPTPAYAPIDLTPYLPGGAFGSMLRTGLLGTLEFVNVRIVPDPLPISLWTVWYPTFDNVTYTSPSGQPLWTAVGLVTLSCWDALGVLTAQLAVGQFSPDGSPTTWTTLVPQTAAFWRLEVTQTDLTLNPLQGLASLHADFYCGLPTPIVVGQGNFRGTVPVRAGSLTLSGPIPQQNRARGMIIG